MRSMWKLTFKSLLWSDALFRIFESIVCSDAVRKTQAKFGGLWERYHLVLVKRSYFSVIHIPFDETFYSSFFFSHCKECVVFVSSYDTKPHISVYKHSSNIWTWKSLEGDSNITCKSNGFSNRKITTDIITLMLVPKIVVILFISAFLFSFVSIDTDGHFSSNKYWPINECINIIEIPRLDKGYAKRDEHCVQMANLCRLNFIWCGYKLKQFKLHQVNKVETVVTLDNQRNFAVRRMLYQDFSASMVLNKSHQKHPLSELEKRDFVQSERRLKGSIVFDI